MKIPKDIAAKVAEYEEAQKKADRLFEELDAWFEENVDDTLSMRGLSIVHSPAGVPQRDGSYWNDTNDQEDWIRGIHYYPIEDSDQYVAYSHDS